MSQQFEMTGAPDYWALFGSAGTLKGGQWILDAQDRRWESMVEELTRKGQRIPARRWPAPAPLLTYKQVASVPDICWAPAFSSLHVVSDRLRNFIEAEAPGAARFLPVRVSGPRRSSLHRRYWAVNWLRVWDCHVANWPEIDVRRIPPPGDIGVVAPGPGWYAGAPLVRSDVRLKMERACFVGLRLAKVRRCSKPTDTVLRKNRVSGKLERIEYRLIPEDRHFDVNAYFADGRGANDPTDVPNSTAFHGYVVLHSAMCTLDPRVVLRFLKEGGDPNAGVGVNVSPLLVVLYPKLPRLLRALHSRGADWNIANTIGVTPLMSAAIDADVAAIRVLLDLGADPTRRDFGGCTALDHLPKVSEQPRRSDAIRRAAALLRAASSRSARPRAGRLGAPR